LDPDKNIPTLLLRIRNVDSAIVSLNIVSVISRWIDKSNIKNKYVHAKRIIFTIRIQIVVEGK
jgi:hypothetical protein